MDKQRIDKWLWAARFYKTRRLAVDEIDHGRVKVNGQPAKPSREVKPGDEVSLQQGGVTRVLHVQGLSLMRGPAPEAQTLYTETADSVAAREAAAQQRRLAPEPGHSLSDGRPTKRDRRQLDRVRDNDRPDDAWGHRWSAQI
ncbi:RNA-binding S4 domain-containing protein [Comamonadaceae bacterium PP-2]